MQLYCILYITLFFSLPLQDDNQQNTPPSRPLEEWMLICQHNTDLQPNIHSQPDFDWTQASQLYPNLEETPSFISQRQTAGQHIFTTTADPNKLQGKQLQVYTTVQQHHLSINPPPLQDCLRHVLSTVVDFSSSTSYMLQLQQVWLPST